MISKRQASATGGATAGDTAIGLRTTFSSGSSAGVSDYLIESSATLLRQSSASGSGASSVTQLRTAVVSAVASGGGDSYGVFWNNLGSYWNAVVKTRPLQMERPDKSPFRRGTNYSVRVPR